uniref:ran-binding protein 3-like isoform X4 n=1 Tax=Ictidomys tridecemlineatus TaxID=43179 RepID=UPI001A9E36ED|nr:ran-binding protein 3-like isoform X4 [Ictidomys tridecemlineatus]
MSTTQRKGSSHLFTSPSTCHLQEDQRQQEKSVIAEPIFVFEKGERTFKRPAEDTPFEAAEPDCNRFSRKRVRSSSFTLCTADSPSQGVSTLSKKRLRSSSFTDLPTFPPSGPVKKNNVFMTSSLVQMNADVNSAEQGPVKHSEHVLRPATLQPPHQAQSCEKIGQTFEQNASESCKIKEKMKHKISEENPHLLSENLPSARISVPLSTNQQFSGSTSVGCQPNGKFSFKSCSLEFVFGENMVERVLINCKLFIFNKTTQSWIERGRGTLRLNDTASSDCGTLQSRLIMRNQGSLRLILNSKLWAQMKVQRANRKNLRITATNLEDNSIKVFLIQASVKDTGFLYAAIHHRLVALRSFDKLQKDVNQSESQSETVLQQLSCESCDEEEDDFTQVTKSGSDPSRWTNRQSVACS